MRLKLLLSTLVLATVIMLLQKIALAEFLYWKWWWFDILMHFLGGVLVGGIGLIISDIFKTPRKITLFLSLLAIGIGWEVFEYVFGLYDGSWDPVDTSIDLIMDGLGVLVVYSGVKLWK